MDLRSLGVVLFGLLVLSAPGSARGDEFARLIGVTLFEIPTGPGVSATAHLGLRAIESLPEVLRGERSALILATTDQGNLAKLLVSVGLRRQVSSGDQAKMATVLSLDRFETIDRGDRATRTAHGRDVLLFDGFEFDLDSGQVVPAGFGGDLAFSTQGERGPELVALGKNRLYAIDKPLKLPGVEAGRPSAGTAVVPADFNGRYTLVSNGQLSGSLELSVAQDASVTGRFRSDRNGAIYPLTGKVGPDLSRRIEFEIRFPRSKQSFDGLLWTGDKNVFAGTVTILEHLYSFVAVREGMAIVPESIDATSAPRSPSRLKMTTRVVTLEPAGEVYGLDGVARSAEELRAALSAAHGSMGPVEVLIRVPPSTPFERVERLVRLVRETGIGTIRLASLESQ